MHTSARMGTGTGTFGSRGWRNARPKRCIPSTERLTTRMAHTMHLMHTKHTNIQNEGVMRTAPAVDASQHHHISANTSQWTRAWHSQGGRMSARARQHRETTWQANTERPSHAGRLLTSTPKTSSAQMQVDGLANGTDKETRRWKDLFFISLILMCSRGCEADFHVLEGVW
jgi:hypothetical protein